MIKKDCLICGKVILEYPSRVKDGRGKYCSKVCMNKGKADPVISKDCREKLSKYWTGRLNIKARKRVIVNCFFCNKEKEIQVNQFIRASEQRNNRIFCNRDCRAEYLKTLRREKTPAWQGGRLDLYQMVRRLPEMFKWRDEIFKRDNYTCVKCGDSIGGNLEAHHKQSFSILFHNFINTFNQFSPIEDKEVLLRIAIIYHPFFDLDNGETLCIDCHKHTDNYGRKKSNKHYSDTTAS
jgi:hypothetical protein